MRGLADRVAVITGAGSGIGLATAMRLASEGTRIVAVDVDEAERAAFGKILSEEVAQREGRFHPNFHLPEHVSLEPLERLVQEHPIPHVRIP